MVGYTLFFRAPGLIVFVLLQINDFKNLNSLMSFFICFLFLVKIPIFGLHL